MLMKVNKLLASCKWKAYLQVFDTNEEIITAILFYLTDHVFAQVKLSKLVAKVLKTCIQRTCSTM